MKAADVYAGSDGVKTRQYYAELLERGIIGTIAVNLFRAQKSSSRAKVYHGKYRGMSYDKKQWSMDVLCDSLLQGGAGLGITFGWCKDEGSYVPWVLYVDLPTGQVSFHSPARGKGPDYPKAWDGIAGASESRILEFCEGVMAGKYEKRKQDDPGEHRERSRTVAAARPDHGLLATGPQLELFGPG